MQSISDTFFLNGTYICALFKKHLDMAFSQYLTSARLEKAKFYLSHTRPKQLEIAEKLGFGVSTNWSVINVYSGEDPVETGIICQYLSIYKIRYDGRLD